MNKIDYIIIQAGGKGTRMKHNTWNRPKCLVPVIDKPVLYHLFEKFEKSKFIIIGDYLFNTLDTYINTTLEKKVDFKLIKTNKIGEIAGIKNALEYIPYNKNLCIIWSDLFFINKIDNIKFNRINIGVTNDFECRWSINKKNKIIEKKSNENGILGFFFFPNKSILKKIPEQGSFLKWYSSNIKNYKITKIDNVIELGEDGALDTFRKNNANTRFFNKIEIQRKKNTRIVIKTPIKKSFKKLIKDEVNWYKFINNHNLQIIPKIHKYDPLTIDFIPGKHPYQLNNNKSFVLEKIIDSINKIHNIDIKKSNNHDLENIYLKKTISRVEKIKDLIPEFNQSTIKINNLNCMNVFHDRHVNFFENEVKKLININFFNIIHGDPTFSNMLYYRKKIYFIDPRGSFGNQKLYGDKRYDFSKLYYSLFGNYDNFNKKKFILRYINKEIEIYILDSNWSQMHSEFENLLNHLNINEIKLIHSLIWLSLTSYVQDDYDAMLAAFYNGIWHFNKLYNN